MAAGLLLAANGLSAQSNITVKGLGPLENRRLDAQLAFLLDCDPDEPVALDAALLEDSAFLLLEQLKRMGYLRPAIGARLVSGEAETAARWDAEYAIQLPADATADRVVFRIERGVLYYYDTVEVGGASALAAAEARRFFIPGGALYTRRTDRAFTLDNLDRRINRLLRTLEGMGHRTARETDRAFSADPLTGAVRVRVEVEQGPLHRVRRTEVVRVPLQGEPAVSGADAGGVPFTPDWEQQMRAALIGEAYGLGHPDARLRLEETGRATGADGSVLLDLRFTVEHGPLVTLSGIAFAGDRSVRERVLIRQAQMRTGQPLNLLEAGEARRRIMGLGVFNSVRLGFEHEDQTTRRVVFELEPGPRKNLQLLGGWGSYERARAGLRWTHRNPWGRAHQYDFGAKVSMRSSEVQLAYSIPQIFGTLTGAYINAGHAFREELSYDRSTTSVAVGAGTLVGAAGISVATEYSLKRQETERRAADAEGAGIVTVAGLTVRAALDRRDDFLTPSSGYQVHASLETASRYLGGEVNFVKLEAGISRHRSVSSSTLLHGSLRFGLVRGWDGTRGRIPFNERFFSGGENTVRGYREGRASPLDANGDEIGAEAYALANLELEQRLLPNLSAVVFVDAVGLALEGMGAGQELLYSVGLGLRYQTVVGPVRVEYGYNPEPRPQDPRATLHVSIGFPF